MGTNWLNDDGLNIQYGTRTSDNQRPAEVAVDGVEKELVIDFAFDSLPSPTNGDGGIVSIPSGASIISATLIGKTAWTGLTDMDIGLQNQDGSEIDNDGLVANELAVTAGEVVTGAGALVGTTTAAEGYIVATAAGATAGTAKLVVKYIVA